jgi:hypothetical protein
MALAHCSVSQSVCGATMEWTEENTLGFIELYEKMSVLWDPNHPKYYNKLHNRLKYSVVKPLLKNNERSLISNYRPISLLTGFSKIFELLIAQTIKHHLVNHNVWF